jgi:hypothetical protein
MGSYKLGSGDVGSTMAVKVTASNSAGSATATSAPTAVVAAVPPQNTSPPAVSGTDTAGQTLQTTTGSWTGTAPLTFAYQWARCDSSGGNCTNVSGATSSSYTLSSADVGSMMRAFVWASNSAGSAAAASQATAPVASGGLTASFSGTISKNASTLSFPVTIGAGEADARLTFSKAGTATVLLVDSQGAVVARASGGASPLKLNVPGLAAGSYRYVVSCTGYKGSFSFALAVSAPSP